MLLLNPISPLLPCASYVCSSEFSENTGSQNKRKEGQNLNIVCKAVSWPSQKTLESSLPVMVLVLDLEMVSRVAILGGGRFSQQTLEELLCH